VYPFGLKVAVDVVAGKCEASIFLDIAAGETARHDVLSRKINPISSSPTNSYSEAQWVQAV
jgi:hypothetical protein